MIKTGKLLGLCSACIKYDFLTKHHIFPKNWTKNYKKILLNVIIKNTRLAKKNVRSKLLPPFYN